MYLTYAWRQGSSKQSCLQTFYLDVTSTLRRFSCISFVCCFTCMLASNKTYWNMWHTTFSVRFTWTRHNKDHFCCFLFGVKPHLGVVLSGNNTQSTFPLSSLKCMVKGSIRRPSSLVFLSQVAILWNCLSVPTSLSVYSRTWLVHVRLLPQTIVHQLLLSF